MMMKVIRELLKIEPRFSKKRYYAEVENLAHRASRRLSRGNIVRQHGDVLSEKELIQERVRFQSRHKMAS